MHQFQTTKEQAIHHLLTSLDSTTYMLEELLQTTLSIRVFEQRIRMGAAVPESVRIHVNVQEEDLLMVRTSGLFEPNGHQVSENYVATRLDSDKRLLDLLQQGVQPIIKLLEHDPNLYSRRMLGNGVGVSTIAGQQMVVCQKHYLICSAGNPILYIHERFHPDLIDPNAVEQPFQFEKDSRHE